MDQRFTYINKQTSPHPTNTPTYYNRPPLLPRPLTTTFVPQNRPTPPKQQQTAAALHRQWSPAPAGGQIIRHGLSPYFLGKGASGPGRSLSSNGARVINPALAKMTRENVRIIPPVQKFSKESNFFYKKRYKQSKFFY